MSNFVPAHFTAPESAVLAGLFLLQRLGPPHAEADFAAVRSSAESASAMSSAPTMAGPLPS